MKKIIRKAIFLFFALLMPVLSIVICSFVIAYKQDITQQPQHLVLLNKTEKASPTNIEKFTSMLDSADQNIMTMLGIVLAIMALLGTGAYALIYALIKDQFNQEIKKMQFYTKAQTLKALGVIEYYRFLDDHKNGRGGSASGLLMKAEKDTSDALNAATELYKLEPNKDHDLLLCILKNNMACIIVRIKDKKRKFEALEHIRYAYKRISNYPEHAYEWEDTKNMVKKDLFDDATSNEAYREPLKKWARRCFCERICR